MDSKVACYSIAGGGVTFLDPDKRKADFKREADAMDEVKAYMKEHPTYHPGHNDWVLEP
ncbi:hypothetical protein [Luteimonas sp. TWI1437]|uniref:hypothetical protein n=1 Tax=unclassified Luteimonas TaxID=2629088 RepID=UPI0032079A79